MSQAGCRRAAQEREREVEVRAIRQKPRGALKERPPAAAQDLSFL